RLRVAVLAPGGRTVTEEGPAAKILPRCGYCRPMHTVAVIALPDVIAFDLTTAAGVFGRVVLPSGAPGYRVRVRYRSRRQRGADAHRHRARHLRGRRRGHD